MTDDDVKKLFAEFSANPGAPKSMEDFAATFPLGKEKAEKFVKSIIVRQRLFTKEVLDKIVLDPAEVAKEISNVTSNAANAAKVAADAEKKIKELKASLDKVAAAELPAKFAELAKKESACPCQSLFRRACRDRRRRQWRSRSCRRKRERRGR